MSARAFADLAAEQWSRDKHLCVGLDSDVSRIPASVDASYDDAVRVTRFNAAIVASTADLAAAYKPNVAFYEALGPAGLEALARTIDSIKQHAPDVPVILDAKRADIGSTNLGYVTALFDELGADAVTVHPYLGGTALSPFLSRVDKQTFVLARTSNPGAHEFQDLICDGLPLYRHVARAVARDWNANDNCGLVVGATYPEELQLVRRDIPTSMPILVPGVGAQGGDLSAAVRANTAHGSSAFFINASRSIIFASAGDDFAAAARIEAQRLNDEIRRAKGM